MREKKLTQLFHRCGDASKVVGENLREEIALRAIKFN